MMKLANVIFRIRPNTEFVIVGDELSGLTFHTPDVVMPTQQEIDEAILAIEAEAAAESEAADSKKAAILAALAEATGYTADELKQALNA